MFGWAEQKSSQAFKTKCVQTYVCGLEIRSVSFFVKQFILRLFLWNVNCALWISVYFLCCHGCIRAYAITPSCFLSVFLKAVHSTKQSFTSDAIFYVTSAMTCHAKVQAKWFSVSSVSRYAVAYLLQRKFVLRSISTMCASEHIKQLFGSFGMSP